MTINYDPIASNNTSINGVPLAENVMLPSDVNDAIRELMADIAQSFPSMDLAVNIEGDASTRIFLHGGTTPDLVGAQAGAVTISTGDSTITTVDAAVDDFLVESAGDAGVSIVGNAVGKASLAMGNADDPDGLLLERLDGGDVSLTTEGSKRLSITSAGLWSIYGGTAPDLLGAQAGALTISTGDSGLATADTDYDDIIAEVGAGNNAGISIIAPDGNNMGIAFGTNLNAAQGAFRYDSGSSLFELLNGGAVRIAVDSIGRLGVGTTSPQRELHVESGNPILRLSDNNSTTAASATGQIEFYDRNNTNIAALIGTASTLNGHVTFRNYTGDDFRFQINNTAQQLDITNPSANSIQLNCTTGELQLESTEIIRSATLYADTTANAVNMTINSSGRLQRSTSSKKYKKYVVDIPTARLTELLNLRGVAYKSNIPDDDQDIWRLGIIAEEAAAAGLEELVVRDDAGEPEYFAYDRLTTLLLEATKAQHGQIQNIIGRLDAAGI